MVSMDVPAELASESFCYLTTTGRVSGDQHTIEIWFALRVTSVYMLSGGRERADWVRNLIAHPQVHVRIGTEEFSGRARTVDEAEEEAWAREALVSKYQGGYGGDLTNSGRTALPIAVDLA